MTHDTEEFAELDDGDAAFVARIRETYRAYPSPLLADVGPRARTRRRFALVAAAAAVMIIAIAGGEYVASRDDAPADPVIAGPPSEPNRGQRVTEPTSPGVPRRILLSTVARSWPHQTVETCADYRPGRSPEVVYVDRFTEACLAKVPFGSSAVFSSVHAGELGGIGWEVASEPWIDVDGVQVRRKVRGDEMQISSRVIQGIWIDEPREYAVYFGHADAANALEALDPEHEVGAPDGASE